MAWMAGGSEFWGSDQLADMEFYRVLVNSHPAGWLSCDALRSWATGHEPSWPGGVPGSPLSVRWLWAGTQAGTPIGILDIQFCVLFKLGHGCPCTGIYTLGRSADLRKRNTMGLALEVLQQQHGHSLCL